jgi:hypothetical protein
MMLRLSGVAIQGRYCWFKTDCNLLVRDALEVDGRLGFGGLLHTGEVVNQDPEL